MKSSAKKTAGHIYTQFDSLVHLESIGLDIPVSAFDQVTPFTADVELPW